MRPAAGQFFYQLRGPWRWALLLAVLLPCTGLSPESILAQAAPQPNAAVVLQTLSPSQATALIRSRENLAVVDVRTPQEREKYRLQGSQLILLGDLVRGQHELLTNQPILLYCAVGGRSALAARILNNQGFQEVYNLAGGIEAWLNSGLGVDTSMAQQ